MPHFSEVYSKGNKNWNCEKPDGGWVGGTFKVSNTSGGYHGILKQWWDYYNKGGKVLLISESNRVKEEFKRSYPNWEIYTTDFFDRNTDFFVDICSKQNPFTQKFDMIINQATLEHVYNPFQAMENLIGALNINGILLTHTHAPLMEYHQYPRDYMRFMKDWWYDLPKYISDIELLEFVMSNNIDVFTLYRKLT
jgi:hypothetical protein